MSAADERIAQLLDRWLASVELHVRYLDLDDAAYAKVQDWPKHQRPTRWVIELARKRVLELKRLLGARPAKGDDGFAEALELMSFLTSLLGSEHVERFIPLAQPRSRAKPAPAALVEPTVKTSALKRAAAQPPRRSEPRRPEPRPAPPTRPGRSAGSPSRRPAAPSQHAAAPGQQAPAANDKTTATVIRDAVRLIRWGSEWPQLAGMIARLADRPPEADVLKILRRHRAEIEAQVRRPPD